MTFTPKIEHTTSPDGTQIAYQVQGVGPALVVVTGSVGNMEQWQDCARELAKYFTVYLYDRRGRGNSGDHPEYSIATEVEDLQAILKVACPGARVLAHSYGALCALQHALTHGIQAELFLFEPPLNLDRLVAGEYLVDYRAAIEAGDHDRAMRIAMIGMVDLPAEAVEQIAQSPLWPQLVSLAPTWTREFEQIDALGFDHRRYRTLPGEKMHFLVGTKTTPMLQRSTKLLTELLPEAELSEMRGLNHFSHVTSPVEVASYVAQAAGRLEDAA
ncbi:Haloacetate dehalogenase H-1 [Corynebacterium occultum]|uniref:Haloacetate dehalogenase H-1 n=1 Tax=Corynebacterium occultum TaxID=2675219 RepID=A0A6B8VR70_9CORY|nr:alpha/beta hydrolase [Corynebacterium occultum]QGU06603.1 Haloacetate dehalogenase H-1 [Corynebacterium occultum]